jgi:light-harvesting protein B-800-850 alpha chain
MAETDGQHAIWLVVPPKIGLPLFLGTVTLIALLVHASILTHTTWFSGYWQGSKAKTAVGASMEAPAVALAPSAPSNAVK